MSPEQVRLALEAPRHPTEADPPKEQGRQKPEALHGQHVDLKQLGFGPQAEGLYHRGQHQHAANGEEQEELDMSVSDVSGLVPEHRLDLLGGHCFQQAVREHHVANLAKQPHHGGVDHHAATVPDQDVPVGQAYPVADCLQCAPQRSVGQRPG